MTRSFVATLGAVMLVVATGATAEAQSKPATQPAVASAPTPSAFESLSQGNKRIATALFEAQKTTDGGPTPMHAYQATAWFPAAAQGEVTIGLDLRGSAKTAAGRISGFGEALWLGRDALERDAVDLAVVGAVESLANGFVLRDWASAEPLPSTGPAEGAVVFALRRTGSGRARLRDLRFGGTDDTDPGSGDWVPTLSAAARLHEALSGGSAGVTVSLGGGYAVTVDHPESDHPATDHTTTDHTEARRQP